MSEASTIFNGKGKMNGKTSPGASRGIGSIRYTKKEGQIELYHLVVGSSLKGGQKKEKKKKKKKKPKSALMTDSQVKRHKKHLLSRGNKRFRRSNGLYPLFLCKAAAEIPYQEGRLEKRLCGPTYCCHHAHPRQSAVAKEREHSRSIKIGV